MGVSCYTSPGSDPVCTSVEDETTISTPQRTTESAPPSSESAPPSSEVKPISTSTPALTPISTFNPVSVTLQGLESSAVAIPSTDLHTNIPIISNFNTPLTGSPVSTDLSGTTTAGVLSQTSGATVSSTSNGSKGVSAGAVAGIAIAMLFIGAAVAFLAAFFLFKRRERTHGSTSDSVPELSIATKSGTGPNKPEMMHVGSSSRAAKGDIDLTNLSHSSDFLASVLPQTADDHEVKERVGTLYDLVHLHVENYYRDVHITLSASTEKDLGGFLTPESARLLRGSVRSTVAIKHILMEYVLGITAPEVETGNRYDVTLFPRDIAGVGSGDHATITQSPGLPAAYILYRRLAVHVHSSLNPPLSVAVARNSAIHNSASRFSDTFFPWANPSYSDQGNNEHLAHVLQIAVDLQVWLVGQPFLYEFVWEDGVGRRGVVVAPGLTKVSDARGNVERRKGQVLLSPLVANG